MFPAASRDRWAFSLLMADMLFTHNNDKESNCFFCVYVLFFFYFLKMSRSQFVFILVGKKIRPLACTFLCLKSHSAMCQQFTWKYMTRHCDSTPASRDVKSDQPYFPPNKDTQSTWLHVSVHHRRIIVMDGGADSLVSFPFRINLQPVSR